MMKRFRFLTLAAMLVLPLAACDEGGDPIGTVAGSVTGTVTIDGAGAAGVTVTLSNGVTATTNATGGYTFSDVPSGAYTVTISGFPADAAFPATTQAAVVATAGQVVSVNFAGSRVRTSAITGSVTTTGGGGLNGVTVTLAGPESRSTTTGSGGLPAGQFSLAGLRAGTYTVTISTVPAGNTCSTTSASVTVAAGETKVQNFTCTATAGAAGSISGQLFLDLDGDGIVDAGETTLGLSGVTVRLEGPTIGVVDTHQTTDGRYSFANKPAGTYNVSVSATDPTFANAGVSLTSPASRTVTLTAGGAASADFGFTATRQRVNVYAYLGRDAQATGVDPSIGTGDAPVRGVIIDLYATLADALNNTATGLIGRDTTDARGEVQFDFLRTADTSPAGATPDQVVFAQFVSAPANHTLNGETRIEIRYDPRNQPQMAPDTFDLLNTGLHLKFDAFGASSARPALAGWDAELFRNDTTLPREAVTLTNAQGRADFSNLITPLGNLPDTFYVRLAQAQAAAAGHAFTQTPAAEAGTAVGSFLRYVHRGTARASDTIDAGDELVRFADTEVFVRVHHEADDSVNGGLPRLSSGDNFTGAGAVLVTLSWTGRTAAPAIAAGSVSAGANPTTGVVVFPVVPTNAGTYRLSTQSTDGNVKVLEEDTLFSVGTGGSLGDLTGGTNSTRICPLGPNTAAGCSTFAVKWENSTINVTVTDITGAVNADSVKVRIRSDPRTIQPRPTDTTLTVSRAPSAPGWATLMNVRDGFYIVSILHDSVTASGDTVWAFEGAANNTATVDVTGPADVDNVVFRARRGDTQIRGVIVNDRDSDTNTIDPGEGLAGVTLNLYRDNSGAPAVVADSLVKTTTTDANGAYSFTGLRQGRYIVRALQPTGAIVLRSFTGTGTVVDTAVVTTTANPTATCEDENNRRQVGTNDVTCFSPANPLPRWDYGTSAAQNVYPTHFTFLYSTGTVTGLIRKNDLTAVAGMSVTLRRCLASTAPNTPTAGPCGSYDTSFAAVNTTTDSSGRYTFPNLREGVYEATPNPASVTGYSSTTPTQMLFTINAPSDIETGNFTANP